jgi:hypothetical protein
MPDWPPQLAHWGYSARWNEKRMPGLMGQHVDAAKGTAMLIFEIGGGIFILLFLAAAMSSIESAHD